ncbi:MAG: phenylacetate--CoA ligase family protein [Spirochaetes bacterium]|jgi:phenylacetate-CoA ligase|nr:phenylacetate--CoA ligase family protein [Spirochaetota bacterium]
MAQTQGWKDIDVKRPYWNMEVETKFNTPGMKELQNRKFVEVMPQMYNEVPLIKRRMDEAGVKPSDIKSIEDISKIPMWGQNQIRDILGEIGFDLKKMISYMMGERMGDDIYVIAATSGSTGVPTPYPLTRANLRIMRELNNRVMWRCGLRPGHRIVLGFGLSMFLVGAPMLLMMEEFPGITIIPVGAEAGTERLVNFTRLFGGDVLMCTPSLALHLIEKSEDLIGGPISDLGFKILLCGAEPGAGIPEVKNRIESAYKTRLFDAGGGFGVSCDHKDYQGMHWIADDLMYYELINPDTGLPVPLEDGATGLGTMTSLTLDMPALRTTMGDVHQVFTDTCPCGRSGFRYKIVGRTDDMLKVKGVMVYPAQIKAAVEAMIPKTTGEFRIILDAPPPRVEPPLKVKIEFGENFKEGDLPKLNEEMAEKFHKLVKIRPKIEWVKPFTFERSDKKTAYIVKTYEKK